MASELIRIFSDLHYGDRGSRARTLSSIQPLLDGATTVVMNGDTIDTRPSRTPHRTDELREETMRFFAESAPSTVFLTGNHDPDISLRHTLDLAGGRIFVTHGDIIFDDLVPWGQDAPILRQKIAAELAALPAGARDELDSRFTAYRRVAASIPQRHQSERNGLKYIAGFLSDTVWPPTRIYRVLDAWSRAPGLAADLIRRHRPEARFMVMGHIHHPGFWRRPDGLVVINTGSFSPPLGAAMVEISPEWLALRSIDQRNNAFYPGRVLASFPLAG
ncbi:MAG: metallophosphoesterase [Verrucomicrobia bacterium]|nr:metallophosphoesterase [Verrucomicrobiota bacterium]